MNLGMNEKQRNLYLSVAYLFGITVINKTIYQDQINFKIKDEYSNEIII